MIVDKSPTVSVMVRHAQPDGNVSKTQGTNVLVETRLWGTAGQGRDSPWRSPVERIRLVEYEQIEARTGAATFCPEPR